jgi:hypothetical protein
MSKRIHFVVTAVVGMLIVLLAGLASSALAGQDAGAGALGTSVPVAEDGQAAPLQAVRTSLTRMPLYFIENRGQMDERVAYYVQGQDKTLYFTPQGVTFVLHGPAPSVIPSGPAPPVIASGSAPPVIPSGSDPSFITTGSAPSVIARSAATKQSPAIESWGLLRLRLAMTQNVLGRGAEPALPRGGAAQSRAAVRRERRPLVLVERQGRRYAEGNLTSQGWIVKLDFIGANTDVQPVGLDATGAVIHYFKGQPDEWVTGLKTYSKVVYPDLWPGIDLEYSGTVNRLKYQFAVAPGADPSQIRLAYRGATAVTTTGAGQLAVSTPLGGFHDGAPHAYQQTEGVDRVGVEVSYELLPASHGQHAYGFRVGDYDGSRPLVIDPVLLVYCGYIGGSKSDGGRGIALDGEGHAYVAGWTASTAATFPETVGPDLTFGGGSDAFVAKVRADGTGLVYCGYIGGSDADSGLGIAVDSDGNAYVTGWTWSSAGEGFPVSVGPDLLYNGGDDAFVAKVQSDGSALAYCGYIGGKLDETAYDIAVDGKGNAYVVGSTDSGETQGFPVTVGPDLTFNGGDNDAFVAKVKADGGALAYCGYVGGSLADGAQGIAVDPSGHAYVCGFTSSSTLHLFPAIVGPDVIFNGDQDAFVAKLEPDGTNLIYCGYIGGTEYDSGRGVAVDKAGNAYVTGTTSSSEGAGFPVAVGPDLTYSANDDAFVAKVQASGTALDYCGYIGGSMPDLGEGIAVDGDGSAYVVGFTLSTETMGFPLSVGPDLTHNGGYDAFVAKVKPAGTALVYCGYVGGSEEEHGNRIVVDGWGNAYITGWTLSGESSFPETVGPDLTYNGGVYDAFVARVKLNYAPTLGAVVPSSGSGPVKVTTYFTTTWKDANGWSDLKQCYFHIGADATVVGNVTLLYNAVKNKLWMLYDDASGWTGGCAPGSAGTMENSQAIVHCDLTAVQGSGDTLGVTWAIEFKSGYTGDKKTGLKCKDVQKARAKAKWKGTWEVTAAG